MDDCTGRHLCKKCLVDDGFFSGGGSWAPDSCPKCGGTECVMYENLPPRKQKKARKLKAKMWQERSERWQKNGSL